MTLSCRTQEDSMMEVSQDSEEGRLLTRAVKTIGKFYRDLL